MPKNTGKMTWRGRAPGLRDAPALTLMESPQFRVRMGTVRPGRNPKMKGFIGRIKSLVRVHGGAGSNPRGRGQGGVGGSAAARLTVRANPQRVVVKARVVRHAKYAAAPGGAAGALAKHIDYLGRSGASEDGGPGVVFDADDELTREDLRALRRELVDDRHHFRFIVSPEAGDRLDLKDFARELVKEMQVDLGTPLTWIGVAHYDTDDPHIHLLVRGKDSQGGDLVINRDYLSHGLRLQAQEVATRHLGPRLPEDIERSIQRDLKSDRVTGLDLGIAQQAALHREGWVSALRRNDGSLAGERQRLQTLARLLHLESIGLAREVAPGVWRPDIDLVARLRQLGSRGDIIKLMHERMRGLEPGITTVIFNKENPPTEPVVGRVYARGVSNELSDAQYLLVEARDGKAYYVSLSDYSEKSGQEAGVGSIVRLAPASKQAGGTADRNITRFATTHEGIYDPNLHVEEVDYSARLPPGVSGADYVNSHVKRARALASRGLIEPLEEGRFRIPEDLLKRVRAMPAMGRDSSTVIKVERLSAVDLDAQIQENGITWLDRELAAGAPVGAPVRAGATRFERQWVDAIRRRAEHLRDLGLAEESDGHLRARARFIDELYEREIKDAGRRLQSRYGEQVRLIEGQTFQGRLEAIEQLPSGPHAVVAMPGHYALVPANPHLSQQVGRSLGLKIGRGLDPRAEGPLRLAIRYQFLDLTRTRNLRR